MNTDTKDLIDLVLKIGAALAVVWAYFGDKRHARRTAELDLKRAAYVEYYSSIIPQLRAFGEFSGFGTNIFPMAFDEAASFTKLTLLADQKSLRALIKMRRDFYAGIMELTNLKVTALSIADDPSDGAIKERLAAWVAFFKRWREVFDAMQASYSQALPLARADIEMGADIPDVVKMIESDAQLALEKVQKSHELILDAIRNGAFPNRGPA